MVLRRADFTAALLIVAAALTYSIVNGANHLALHSNAFDLSVFDYALWSATQGKPGWVPFFGHTLQSHHFMPALAAVFPIYWLFQDPMLLIGLQTGTFAAAAVLLWRLARTRLPSFAALALLAAFLFSRRSHSAATSVYYIESLEPLLAFALVWAVSSKQWVVTTLISMLLLGCKEDVAIYTATAGGVLLLDRDHRRLGLIAIAGSLAWLAIAMFVAIPGARVADGLGASNPFFEARFADGGSVGLADTVGRLFTGRSLSKLFGVLGMTGLVALFAPRWLAVALPGILLNLMARPDTLQSGLIGHYLWPILPPLFLASIHGAAWLAQYPKVIRIWSLLLVTVTVADSPLWRQPPWARVGDAHALRAVRTELGSIAPHGLVLAQPQLIPHLPHRLQLAAIGRELGVTEAPAVVLLCDCGDPWPLTPESFRHLVSTWRADSRYAEKHVGPLLVFTLEREQVGHNH